MEKPSARAKQQPISCPEITAIKDEKFRFTFGL
jgi:hypothetical protein